MENNISHMKTGANEEKVVIYSSQSKDEGGVTILKLQLKLL